jgi:hypothetical protein
VPIPDTDLDGDGRADLVVWRPDTGTWSWRTSTSGFSGAASAQWGAAGDIPIFASGSRIDPGAAGPGSTFVAPGASREPGVVSSQAPPANPAALVAEDAGDRIDLALDGVGHLAVNPSGQGPTVALGFGGSADNVPRHAATNSGGPGLDLGAQALALAVGGPAAARLSPTPTVSPRRRPVLGTPGRRRAVSIPVVPGASASPRALSGSSGAGRRPIEATRRRVLNLTE